MYLAGRRSTFHLRACTQGPCRVALVSGLPSKCLVWTTPTQFTPVWTTVSAAAAIIWEERPQQKPSERRLARASGGTAAYCLTGTTSAGAASWRSCAASTHTSVLGWWVVQASHRSACITGAGAAGCVPLNRHQARPFNRRALPPQALQVQGWQAAYHSVGIRHGLSTDVHCPRRHYRCRGGRRYGRASCCRPRGIGLPSTWPWPCPVVAPAPNAPSSELRLRCGMYVPCGCSDGESSSLQEAGGEGSAQRAGG